MVRNEIRKGNKPKKRIKTHKEKRECKGCIYRTGTGDNSVCNYYLETNKHRTDDDRGKCACKKTIDFKKE